MRRTRRSLLAAAAASMSLAGCVGDDGGDTGNGDATQTPTETATESPTTTTSSAGRTETTTDDMSDDQTTEQTTETGPTVSVRSHAELGDILVGPEGLTLYMFEQDTEGEPSSACTGGCADAWPPLTVEGTPSASDEVTASLDTFEREDGSTQVMAGGWPLYYYASDTSPGDAMGQGANDIWWVLDPSGEPIRSTSSGTTTTDDGGGMY